MNKKCQVFTPRHIVLQLLNVVNYEEDLYGKKIIENACGDGNILTVIVERYITDCIKKEMTNEEIKIGIENDIYGAEIDMEHHVKCIQNLNAVATKYGVERVNWNILNVDILKEDLKIKFDYVVGNPPYITYKELDIETREFVRENFDVCKLGKFDYCYAFIEASIKMLSANGKMSYLIPSSIFKNVFADKLREFILPHVYKIIDFQTIKLFDVLTSSAIIVCGNNDLREQIEYINVDKKTSFDLFKKDLTGKWEFSRNKFKVSDRTARLGDFFHASITPATLYNKAFILNNVQELRETEQYISINSYLIEKELLRVAASPRTKGTNRKELIIFPYYYQEGKLIKYSTEEFEGRFPEAAKYLNSFRKELDERDSDKTAKWFEYGRTQALAHLNQNKLLLSTVVTKNVNVYDLSVDCIPYSGIYITQKSELNLEFAKSILESEAFLKYVKSIGINANGSSLRITVKDINNFLFPLKGD